MLRTSFIVLFKSLHQPKEKKQKKKRTDEKTTCLQTNDSKASCTQERNKGRRQN